MSRRLPTPAEIAEAQSLLIKTLPAQVRDNPTKSCWCCGISLEILDRVYIKTARVQPAPSPADFFLLCSLCRTRMPKNAMRDVLLLWLRADFSPQKFRGEFLSKTLVSFADVLSTMHSSLGQDQVEKILRVGMRKVRAAQRGGGIANINVTAVEIISRHLQKYIRDTRTRLLGKLGGSLAR